ncbi:putative tricarboxylic transport membrane protein [Hoeflea marina]|uniref:Putative tricarboxylic transport membrane protein n=1 Tax=Hoeflea marina TaxID=274592 RepID=A0A317PCX1_9HYPH|nr:tripartite tricarboxylate transporter TctB family protein [Hoeflea marina]PWV97485.1 putative tricarboxylic transport membrane protein [Hoeflea marina]
MSDRILGGFGLLLTAFFIWRTSVIELSFISDPFGPKAFPYIISVVFGLASLVVFLRPDTEPEWPPLSRMFEIGMTVAVMVAYALVLPELGFVISTALTGAYLSWRLGTPPLKALAAGVAISLGIFVVFHLILGLSLARGPFGF